MFFYCGCTGEKEREIFHCCFRARRRETVKVYIGSGGWWRVPQRHRHLQHSRVTAMSSTNWADAGAELAPPEVIDNGDGTKTIISYRYNEQKKKIKVTQKVKFIKTTETVNSAIAKRLKWKKFGREAGSTVVGPDTKSTQLVGEVKLILSTTWKADTEKEKEMAKKSAPRSALKCRVCGNTGHYTAKCPYKDTLGIDGVLKPAGAAKEETKPATFASKYKLPHMRAGADGVAPPTEVPALRISNLNAAIDRDSLEQLVSRYGPCDRVSILRNRATGEPLGVAFVNMMTRSGAEKVMEALDGKGLMNMILSVDWARPK